MLGGWTGGMISLFFLFLIFGRCGSGAAVFFRATSLSFSEIMRCGVALSHLDRWGPRERGSPPGGGRSQFSLMTISLRGGDHLRPGREDRGELPRARRGERVVGSKGGPPQVAWSHLGRGGGGQGWESMGHGTGTPATRVCEHGSAMLQGVFWRSLNG
ncbi:hypothetical protein B0I37DRAFT_9228 [Chaetomium sp. MPI-CAGE-AT-0009]|nr:hypothetical protein B0I37DRAFT_9228 [Chaetomium sp. MPI-CAGE-AT-0009]